MKDDSLFERLCQRISLSLLYADRLRHPEPDTTDLIHQFETNYPMGLTALLDLGKTVSHAEETLDIVGAASRRESHLPSTTRLKLPH